VEKINQLMKEWQKGIVMLSSTLQKMGYGRELLKKYVKSGWLESIGYGAFKLSGDNIEWAGAIQALQNQKNSTIHAGGKTALILKGYAHYLGDSIKQVDLFGNVPDKLPKWFSDKEWGTRINYLQTRVFKYRNTKYYTSVKYNEFNLLISAPELAAMEMLSLIPKGQSFDEALKITEGLTTLRSQLVQDLLEECNSIKVKRLFLFMAEKHDHDWLKELNLEKINLGSGKRVIADYGVLDKKYNITVPKEYAG